MKFFKTLFIILVFINLSIYTQNEPINISVNKNYSKNNNIPKKTFSIVEINVIFPQKTIYSFSEVNFGEEKIENKTFFSLHYSFNYPVFNKISIGLISGIEYQTYFKTSIYKLGGRLAFLFRNYKNESLFISITRNISTSNLINNGWANLKCGFNFPLLNIGENILMANLFWDYNFFDINEPIISNENPNTIISNSYGFSLAFQF